MLIDEQMVEYLSYILLIPPALWLNNVVLVLARRSLGEARV